VLNIAAFMVVKNDEYYVDMALKSVLPHVKGVYVQDQMSDDGTYEKIASLMRDETISLPGQIFCERVQTWVGDRFGKDYDEPKFRTMAVKRCEEIRRPDWILKLDADEIYTPFFFSQLEKILTENPDLNGVRVAGDRFISKTHRSVHPTSIETSPDGIKFVDPHTQVWRAGKYSYMPNPIISGCLHPVLTPDPVPVYWLEGINNVHLHRLFGPKAFAFWSEGIDEIDRTKPLYPPTSCPHWFNSDVNMGKSEKIDFSWPKYVLDKWATWEGGIW